MTETLELSLSPKYVTSWGLEEAVREILQNCIDCEADGSEVEVSYSGGRLSMTTYGTTLDKSTLLLGESGKDDERYVGKYGEGYKLALLVLTRLGKQVEIITGGEQWIPVFRHSEVFGMETLQIDVGSSPLFDTENTTFNINDVTQDELDSCQCVALDRLLGVEVGATREGKYGKILLNEEYAGKFYVNGLFVQDDTEFKYGYDFLPEYVTLDRDRRAINHNELRELTAKALAACGDIPLVVAGVISDIVDLSDTDAVLDELTEAQSREFKRYYFDKYGLAEDTFVGTQGMITMTGREKAKESSAVVARIIGRANDEEEFIKELEDELDRKDNKEYARSVFARSTYKKLCVWLKKQTRLSKAAREEFLEILKNSNDLNNYWIGLIRDEIDDLLEEG